jgi:ABC-type polysaccharide/polyol phosphate export permease
MWKTIEVAGMLGWHDIRQAYRRSAIGQFWITLGMAVQITAMGIVFGSIFGAQGADYVPFLAISIVAWTFMTETLKEGSKAFITAESLIKQLPLKPAVHVIRVVWKNFVILGHNIVLIPIVLFFYTVQPSISLLLFIPGLILLVGNLAWMVGLIGIASVRYRDLPLIVNSVLTIAFFVTPVMWFPELLPPETAHFLLGYNPFYHLLQIVRLPLLGGFPTSANWILSSALLALGAALSIWVYSRFSKKIPFWL